MRPARTHTALAWLIVGAVPLATLGGTGRLATAAEGFETGETSWKLAQADCQVRVAAHERTLEQAHSGQGCEYFVLQAAAGGSYAYITHAVGPGRVIPELQASLWVLSDRPGVQLIARVVLPRTIDPRTEAPLSMLLFGESQEHAGEWRQLRLADTPAMLDSQIRVVRRQLPDLKVDVREAYIDALVLNVYGGSGLTRVCIDDLEFSGSVASPKFDAVVAAGHDNENSAARERGAVMRGSVLEVEGRPLAPRIIEHRGESFEWLKSLGFNTIALARPPTTDQCESAKQLDLWLIAPPPHVLGGRRIGPEHERILAWDLGAGLAGPELEATRALAQEVRESDPVGRPLVCSPRAKFWNYSRLADILICEPQPLHGTAELDELGRRLHERQALARPGTPIWAATVTEPAEELRAQLEAIAPGGSSRLAIDSRQIRLLALRAAAAGSRGAYFRSSSPLVEGDSRSLALKLANIDLSTIEPWIAAGEYVEELSADDGATRVAVLKTDRSQLLIVTRFAKSQQYELAPPVDRGNSAGETAFVVSGAPRAGQAYAVTPTRLSPLEARRVAGGLRVVLPDAGFVTLVVLAGDSLVLSHLNRHVGGHAEAAAGALRRLALDGLNSVEQVDRELTSLGLVYPEAFESLTDARSHLRNCERLLDGGDFGASQEQAEQTLSSLAHIRRGRWEQAADRFATPVASPCCTTFGALPIHWRLAARLKTLRWGDNVLPAGDFEDLNHLQASGWRHFRGADTNLDTIVELSDRAAHSGATGLVLRANARSESQSAAMVETPPVWITSAPIVVKAGQMVRVKGWCKLPTAIAGSLDGVLIFDSAGGLPLALRATQPGEWREVTFYRAAPADGDFSVTLALTGLGEVWFDDFTVSLLSSGE